MKEIAAKMVRLKYQVVLSTIILLTAVVMHLLPFFVEIPGSNKEMASSALSTMNNLVTMVVTYWIGRIAEMAHKEKEGV